MLGSFPWILSAEQARQVLNAGATLWEVRDPEDQAGSMPGSYSVSWQQFSGVARDPDHPGRGCLLQDAELEPQLRGLGVCQNTPVVVVGSPPKDGRLVWMLRTLGHPQAAMVEAGDHGDLPRGENGPGDFEIRRSAAWGIAKEELRETLGYSEVRLVDVRTPEEFAGQILYGESRPGRLPGALSFFYGNLLDQAGSLLPREQIEQQLLQAGICRDQPMIAYCSGGIRAAWFTCVLVDLGFEVRNYAGSMWEWSAGSAVDYPLVVD